MQNSARILRYASPSSKSDLVICSDIRLLLEIAKTLWLSVYTGLKVGLSGADTSVSGQNGSAKHVHLGGPGGNLEQLNSNRA